MPRLHNEDDDASEPDLDSFYESHAAGHVCRVCGVLVPDLGDYRRVHWDWHEASNGA